MVMVIVMDIVMDMDRLWISFFNKKTFLLHYDYWRY